MNAVHLSRIYREKAIQMDFDPDQAPIHLTLTGGDRPHVGAIGFIQADGSISITESPGHKEGILCQRWCVALESAGCKPLRMEAGIHYDALTTEGIHEVLEITDALLQETLDALAD